VVQKSELTKRSGVSCARIGICLAAHSATVEKVFRSLATAKLAHYLLLPLLLCFGLFFAGHWMAAAS
jgi:hypothetical protein